MFWIKVIIGAIIASARWARRHSFVFGVVVGVAFSGALSAHATSGRVVTHANGGTLSSRVTTLSHACAPTNTGGGVTMCAQPTMYDLAIVACSDNKAYANHMIGQCVDDFLRMKGWR